MKVLFSACYSQQLCPPTGTYGAHSVSVVTRSSDWSLDGWRRVLRCLVEGVRMVWLGRRFDLLALATVGLEAYVAGALRRLVCPRTRIVCVDLILPRHPLGRRLAGLLQRLDAVICIRQGDVDTLRERYGMSVAQCHFCHFPSPPGLEPEAEDGYVYSGGQMHRDWSTLVAALSLTGHRAILGGPVDVPIPASLADRVQVIPTPTRAEGRRLMSRATMVVVPILDTWLPAGPLVLLDALAMGKATVATRVNGTRDYVVDGQNGLLTPPGDAAGLADAINRVMQDAALRRHLGVAAAADARERFTMERLVDKLLEVGEALSAGEI